MNNIQKISAIVLFILLAISALLGAFFYFGGSIPETVGSAFEEKRFTSINLIWGVVLFVLACAITLIFTVVNILKNPSIIKGFLVVLGVSIVLIGISYMMASSEPLQNLQMENVPSPMKLKLVGTGLNLTYIMTAIAFLGIIVSEIIRAVK